MVLLYTEYLHDIFIIKHLEPPEQLSFAIELFIQSLEELFESFVQLEQSALRILLPALLEDPWGFRTIQHLLAPLHIDSVLILEVVDPVFFV